MKTYVLIQCDEGHVDALMIAHGTTLACLRDVVMAVQGWDAETEAERWALLRMLTPPILTSGWGTPRTLEEPVPCGRYDLAPLEPQWQLWTLWITEGPTANFDY